MANQIDKKTIQKALVGATMLATSPAWAKGSGYGTSESQLGVNHLSLEQFPDRNATLCADETADLTLAVDPSSDNFISLEFLVRSILANNQDYILFIAYSTELSASPQISTPKSINKLGLDNSALEIVSIIEIPAQIHLTANSTRLGSVDSRLYNTVSLFFNLDTSTLPDFIRDNPKVYFQAALLTKSNFNAGNFSEMILSEVDTIGFVLNNCISDTGKLFPDGGKDNVDL